MPRRNKTRRLWLNVTQKGVKVSRTEFIKRLIRSIHDGTYELPKGWHVKILWRNTPRGKMRGKNSNWTTEMRASARSSPGWDLAVESWLRRKL